MIFVRAAELRVLSQQQIEFVISNMETCPWGPEDQNKTIYFQYIHVIQEGGKG